MERAPLAGAAQLGSSARACVAGGEWDKLLAATVVTVGVAVPVLVACALWEVYVAPHVLAALIG